MDQKMMVGVSQENQNSNLTTPSRAQKRLFSTSSSSSKRSLFKEEREIRKDNNMSDAESDLGGMSPLALTDQSSCDSSPGRQFVSPLATPEKSPVYPITFKNHLITIPARDIHTEPISRFSSLKRVTQSARFSPRRKLMLSPRSKSAQSNDSANNTLTDQDFIDKTIVPEDMVPESPSKESDFDDQHSYVAETPQKEDPFEQRLITPLGSVLKNIPIPRINRRKLSTMEMDECTSPEIKKSSYKRHLEDSLTFSNAKHQKTEELFNVPRARASLFQEKNNQQKKSSPKKSLEKNKTSTEKEKKFTLNPKSFYGSKDESRKSLDLGWRQSSQIEIKTRRSLPTYNNTQKKPTSKKNKKSLMVCGVGHGIKRPKPKPKPIQSLTKFEKQNDNTNMKSNESKENLNPRAEVIKNNQNEKITESVDADKKFFKCKRGNDAVVSIYDKIKLKIASNKQNSAHANKRAKLDPAFDTADLSVDEPAIQESIEKTRVESILKTLENDWEDDYDSMETCQMISPKTNTLSPNGSTSLKDVTMSPASVLSSMASTMNIEDVLTSPEDEANDSEKMKLKEIPTQKFYPVFSKKYSSDFNSP